MSPGMRMDGYTEAAKLFGFEREKDAGFRFSACMRAINELILVSLLEKQDMDSKGDEGFICYLLSSLLYIIRCT
jgi:hypothetical protein